MESSRLGDGLDHLDEVERDLGSGGRRWLADAGASETHALVKAFEFGSLINEAEFHFAEAGSPTAGFRGVHEFRAQSFALSRGLHRNQAQVGLVRSRFDENARDQRAILFS